MSASLSSLNSTLTAVDFDPFAGGEIAKTALATAAQKEIWASVQMGVGANCAYNESQSLRLRGNLDIAAFQASIQRLIQRHEALRMTVSPDGNALCVNDRLEIVIPVLDLSGLLPSERDRQVASHRQQAVENPFDLEHGPLFRVEILNLQSQDHLVIITAHHIICDGWSWAVLLPDLGQFYSASQQGETLDVDDPEPFSAYALMLEEQAQSDEVLEAEAYWLNQFAGPAPVVDIPTDRPRPAFRTFDSAREDWDVSPQLVAQLKQMGTQLGCSFMSTLLAGFEVWLHRLTGQSDVVVGVLAAGQAATGMYNLVGHCVNLLPMRSQVLGEQSFHDYLQSRKSTILDAYDRQQFTFGSLVEKLKIPRDASRIPLVPILLNIDQGLDPSKLPFAGLTVELSSNPRAYENFELFVNATELDGKLTLECQYNTHLFDAATIRRRMAELETLLAGIVANPSQSIRVLPLLPESERQILADWNQTTTVYPHDLCVHQVVAAQVERTPDAIAVIFEDQRLTYRELDERANQLAHYLQAQGVQPETLVGISLERVPMMVVAMLGVQKAGGAYVPLDPTYPQERLAFMLADSQVSLLLTQGDWAMALPTDTVQVIDLERDWGTIAQHPSTDPKVVMTPQNLAYVIYTSGSTGTPKGVQVPHRGVVNFLTTMQHTPGLSSADILLSVTTLSFDIAVLELMLPLTVGATVVVVSRAVAMNGEALLQTIQRSGATVMQATPATWRILLAAGWTRSPNLRIFSGGDGLPTALAQELLQRVQQVWNLYGPTETTIWSTCYQITGPEAQPWIGKPIANTQIYLLDAAQQPVPIGVPGEIYMGGDGVVRGYLNRPDLTAERFIPNPFSFNPFSPDPQAYLYRTGDLARYLPDGNLQYYQRLDHQVKVRGFRIELGEIEATMTQHPEVKDAIVVVRPAEGGENILVGYVVPRTPGADAQVIPQLRPFLQGKLPEHMLPNVLVGLETLPLTPNGKIDRNALPQPDALRRDLLTHYVAPRTLVEKQIAEIWSQVLKLDPVGMNDNFFELGGYSLLAIQIVSRLRPALDIEIPLPILFELPTISALAERIESLQWAAQGLQAGMVNASNDDEEGDL